MSLTLIKEDSEKKMKKRLIPVILFFAMLSASCVQRPDGVASDSKMASVLADMELAEAWMQNSASTSSDSQRLALEEYIISRHGLTRQEFDSTLAWYARNPDAYYELCELSEKELVKKRRKLEGRSVQEIETSDLWPYSRMAIFSPLQESDGMTFSVPVSQSSKGDQLRLRMRFTSPTDVQARFGVQYDDGVSEFISRRVSNASRLDLTLRTDTSRQVERIFGNLSLEDLKKTIWADSIHITVLPFDSMQYYNRSAQYKVSPPRRRIAPKPTAEDSDSIAQKPDSTAQEATNVQPGVSVPKPGEDTPREARTPGVVKMLHNNSASRLK